MKFYRHLYGDLNLPPTNIQKFCKFLNFAELSNLCSLRCTTFKFGSFTNSKVLFPVVLTYLSKTVHVKS